VSDAVPTIGPAGVRFRSRLEARWAEFFTRMRWPWTYEPELGLDRWIPDFALSCGTGMLVEVKPAVTMMQLLPHYARIQHSGAAAPVWLVGAALALRAGTDPALGWFGFPAGDAWQWREMTAANVGAQTGTAWAFKTMQAVWIAAGNDLQWRGNQ